ncbi:MAG: adenylate/guanylate cyclase, partial [Ignavibacteria bacterium]|nr:adenylate/guanylate cyclase [Ignavibacteria bacterium]
MTVYNFILAFLSGCSLIFGFYYLFAVIFIHKKILDKRFYFVIACFCISFYLIFELILSLEFSENTYLWAHRGKLFVLQITAPTLFLTIYKCFLPKANNFLAKFLLSIAPLFLLTTPFEIFLSNPIRIFSTDTTISTFIYHLATPQISYKFYMLILNFCFICAIIHFFLTKTNEKNIAFVIIIASCLIGAFNDVGKIQFARYNSIMIIEYVIFGFVAFVFYDLLKEDRKIYLSVIKLRDDAINLSLQLQKEKDEVITLKDESIRRLRITEIYTRHSLVESIERGDDPTKFQPNNIQIATLFTDIRDFTGISEGMKPLEVVELLNAYFNRMNSTIIKHNGEIDKLMGDCIMALYKDPDDALKSAIEMRHELALFNKGACSLVNSFDLEKGNLLPYNRTINNGIGL